MDLGYERCDSATTGHNMETDSAVDTTDSAVERTRVTTNGSKLKNSIPQRQIVTDFVFGRNKYVLATLLTSVFKTILLKMLSETTCWDDIFPESVRAGIFLTLISGSQSILNTAKQVMDEVEKAESSNLFLNELLACGEMPKCLKKKVLEICRNAYLPPVPRFMIQLIRNRNEANQEKLMRVLGIKPIPYDDDYDDINDDDDEYEFVVEKWLQDDAALERALSRWIFKKQRSREYNGYCDAEGYDLNALADLEESILNKVKMPLLQLDPDVMKAIHDTLSEKKISYLFKKMRKDLDLSVYAFELDGSFLSSTRSQKRQSQLVTDWLLKLQKRGVISKPLDSSIICYVEIMKQMKALHDLDCVMNEDDDHEYDEDEWRIRQRKLRALDNVSARIQSFGIGKEWDRRHSQSATAMALAGFSLLTLNSTDNPSRDRVTCSRCGIVLKDWENMDDPELEHLWHACHLQCSFLLSRHERGLVRFVERLKNIDQPGGKPRNLAHAKSLYNAQHY